MALSGYKFGGTIVITVGAVVTVVAYGAGGVSALFFFSPVIGIVLLTGGTKKGRK